MSGFLGNLAQILTSCRKFNAKSPDVRDISLIFFYAQTKNTSIDEVLFIYSNDGAAESGRAGKCVLFYDSCLPVRVGFLTWRQPEYPEQICRHTQENHPFFKRRNVTPTLVILIHANPEISVIPTGNIAD